VGGRERKIIRAGVCSLFVVFFLFCQLVFMIPCRSQESHFLFIIEVREGDSKPTVSHASQWRAFGAVNAAVLLGLGGCGGRIRYIHIAV